MAQHHSTPAAGRRLVPHTADLMVEAWGPDRPTCLEQAALSLVESFADTTGCAPVETAELRVETDDPRAQLVALLEEVIYMVDAEGMVPVEVVLEDVTPAGLENAGLEDAAPANAEDGGLQGRFELAPLGETTTVGPAPKAVALHGLTVGEDERGWSCRVVVDV